MVLFVDDLQWADGASLDALRYACRSWVRNGGPVLLVVTAREEGLRENGLGGWISTLGRELAVRRLVLSPLDEGNVQGLLRLSAVATGPGNTEAFAELERLGRWLLEESDGNPLFLAQILGVLLERGVLIQRVGSDGRAEVALSGGGFDEGALRGLVPAGLRELILDKLRPLSTAAADVLAAGAVLGRGFGFGELLRVAGVGETEGIAALDALVSARLLEEGAAASRGTYAFAHEKIREVVYTDAGEARRGVFHRRALEALEERGEGRRGASAAELAQHALAAGLSERAFGHLLAAAEEAMAVFAAGDAVGHYERARELLEDPPRETAASDNALSERLRLYGGLARASALVHNLGRAQEAYEEMLSVAREAGDRGAEWEALRGLGDLGVGFAVGPDDDELLRGVRRREGLGRQTAGAEGASFGAAHSPRVARQYSEGALRLARELDREDLILRSEFGLGVACMWTCEWEESTAHLEEALSFLARLGGGETDDNSRFLLLWSEGLIAWNKGMVDGADGVFGPDGDLQNLWKKAAEIGEAFGTDYGWAQLGGTSIGLAMVGEYEEALCKGTRALEAARSLGHAQFAAHALVGLGDAHRGVFSLGAARSAYTEHRDLAFFSTLRKEFHARLCAVEALSGE